MSSATACHAYDGSNKRYSRPCLPLLWPRLYAEPFGLGEKRRSAISTLVSKKPIMIRQPSYYQAEPSRAEPSRAEPSRAGPSQAEQSSPVNVVETGRGEERRGEEEERSARVRGRQKSGSSLFETAFFPLPLSPPRCHAERLQSACIPVDGAGRVARQGSAGSRERQKSSSCTLEEEQASLLWKSGSQDDDFSFNNWG